MRGGLLTVSYNVLTIHLTYLRPARLISKRFLPLHLTIQAGHTSTQLSLKCKHHLINK